ncbi:hypothetical protein M2145_002547 [Lachnospiraceae bacterium PF1-21]
MRKKVTPLSFWKVIEKGQIGGQFLFLLERRNIEEAMFRIVIDCDLNILIKESDRFEGALADYEEFMEEHSLEQKAMDTIFAQERAEEFGFLSLLFNLHFDSAPLYEILRLEEREEFRENPTQCIANEVLKRIQAELRSDDINNDIVMKER